MRAASSLLICLLFASVDAAPAQSSIGEMTVSVLCDLESGAAARACNEYCRTLACHRAADDDPATEPTASEKDCKDARARFKRLTGREVPCEETAACPCADPAQWRDVAGGMTWQSFALGAAGSDTLCTDDSSETRLEQDASDFSDPMFASVDAVTRECRVSSYGNQGPVHTLRISAREVNACRRLLRRAGGESCRVR